MTDKELISIVDAKAKKLWDEINTGHEYSIIESYNQFYGICMEIAEMVKKEPVSIWHDASEIPEHNDLLIETNDGRIIHRQSINNYGMVKRWAYTSDLLNIDNSCNLRNNSQEKPVIEDLNDKIRKYFLSYKGYPHVMDETEMEIKKAIIYFANWQKEQDQSTIELAEDHAMLAGMEKMKEQMMAKTVEVIVHIDAGGYPYIPQMELYDYDKDEPLAKEGDKYKVVLIKEK